MGLTILLLGSLGMTQYRDGLIAAKLEGVRAQAQVIADIMAQVAADDNVCDQPLDFGAEEAGGCRVALREDYVNEVFNRLWDGFEGRVRVFNAPRSYDELPIPNARDLLLEDVVLRKDEFDISTLPDIEEEGFSFEKMMLSIRQDIVELWPTAGFRRDALSRTLEQELTEAFLAPPDGSGSVASVRFNEEGELVASVSVPVRRVQAVYGVVTAEIGGIQDLVDEARGAILPFFVLALAAAFLSSLLLTATIAQPIRQLAIAADKVREGIAVAGRVRIPDFPNRRDEIGELSSSLRAMTRAIYARIEAIESFAADVSHELKNPLTSIRSATETLGIAKTPEAQEKLIGVIQKDVIRMDRLITDISNASRLDAELARETREIVDVEKLLKDIIDMYVATHKEGRAEVVFQPPHTAGQLFVLGSPTALGQVFRNLIDNAISFSPADKTVFVTFTTTGSDKDRDRQVRVSVLDEGPGIPPENLESIFKRFYTERPAGTAFGNNSGLGLAISRQIVESHGGEVWAENRQQAVDAQPGAAFHVTLPLQAVQERRG
ncbi:MAG: sensor histidine kinase [Aquisalinus sp.]|nr:sensor histidine kinase [Aquisalinus sp.]